MPLVTMSSAMSPTALEVGVTFTMSPNMALTSAYAAATSGQRASSIPSARACSRRLVYCPPGMPCTYTSEAAGADVALERRVLPSHLPPVRGDIRSRCGSTPVSRGPWRSASTSEPRFGCDVKSAHGVDRPVDGVGARVDGRQYAGGGDAAGVVRVEVHRQPDLFLQA